MKSLDIPRLFHAILSPKAEVDAREINRMGLLAVKIAQMYALRPDLLGDRKCLELSRLLENVECLSESAFDQRWHEIASDPLKSEIAEMDRQPIASASLGQVHRAVLKDGRKIAIKLLKRDLRDDFLKDVHRLRTWLRWALRFYPKLRRLADPMDALATVEHQTLREMDLKSEIHGAARLASLAAEGSENLPHLRRLRFPDYFPEFSHGRLLTSSFVEGRTLASWLDSGGPGYQAILDLFRIHGYFLFVRGEFHGDLHPGNIIWHQDQFWFLDNANIETVPRSFAAGLFRMIVLLGKGDHSRAANELAALSLKPLTASQAANFQRDFRTLYQGFENKSASETSLTKQMMRTVRMAVNSGMTFPQGAFPCIKSLMYLDGMVIKTAPHAKLLKDVARFEMDFDFQPQGAPDLMNS